MVLTKKKKVFLLKRTGQEGQNLTAYKSLAHLNSNYRRLLENDTKGHYEVEEYDLVLVGVTQSKDVAQRLELDKRPAR